MNVECTVFCALCEMCNAVHAWTWRLNRVSQNDHTLTIPQVQYAFALNEYWDLFGILLLFFTAVFLRQVEKKIEL